MQRLRSYPWVLIFLVILWASCSGHAFGQETPPADLVLVNGTIHTLDSRRPEAKALAVRGETILAVGSDQDIRPLIGPVTQVIDLEGGFAMPGFIEGHGHLMSLGYAQTKLDLARARTWEEIVFMVRDAARQAQPGEWILGTGWHQEKWETPPSPQVEGYPTHQALSEAVGDHPVFLTHASGHADFANAKAMELAGITRNTVDPSGGRIVRDANGNPTGALLDTAGGLVKRAMEADRARLPAGIREAQRIKALELAVHKCLSKGITSFQDAGSSFETLDFFRKLAEEGRLGIRLWAMVRGNPEDLGQKLSQYRWIDIGDHRLTVRAVKCSMDGALGARTAWLLEPYDDLPSSRGLSVESPDEILKTARLAIREGFQLCVHAIGDRANREAIDIYEAVFRENPEKKDLRWRIEHAQHLSAPDIPRFARLGVIASMQPVHAVSDGPWVIKRLGEKRADEGAYVWRKLLDSGAVVTSGTDTPIEDIDPIANFYAAITRKMPDGIVFYPDQRLQREEALRACTITNAYAAFEEHIKGSLEPGKLADITVLSQNLLTVPEHDILRTEVLYTLVGGKVMYRKP